MTIKVTINTALRAILGAVLLAGIAAAPAPLAAESLAAPQIRRIADSVTTANPDPAYQALLDQEHKALLDRLKSMTTGPLTQAIIETSRQTAPLANHDWLKASGYDFAVKDNQHADIKVLARFVSLPRWQLERSGMIVAEINHDASAAQQEHALFDADGIAYLYFIPEALGPRLGTAFLRAYEKGAIGKAAALIKATEINTWAAKTTFNYTRPFLIDGNTIQLVPDSSVAADGTPYTASGGSFPSGHTNVGVTDALLLAQMLPERFLALIDRGAGYGYSRLVLGVHYPLDVIGSRMIAERNVARFLNDPAYQALFAQARDELRAALEQECGTTVVVCAAPAAGAADPWTAPAMTAFHRFTMTYGLPRSGARDVAMETPAGAEVLLATVLPELSAAERKELLRRTALPSGYPLDSQDPNFGFWQRVDLRAAVLAATVH